MVDVAPSTATSHATPRRMAEWRSILVLSAFYLACAALATWPRVLSLGATLPSTVDPVQHLTLLRWYRGCLLEGRAPWLLTDLQYPIGAPLGNFSPLHLQALLYIPLSFCLSNDVLCYNVLWFLAFVLAGVGTHVLARRVVDDPWSACLGGMLVMLGGPLMTHAHGHLELMYVGLFPLFLAAWMRFVDAPGWRALASAVGWYLLMVMGAAYFAVLAVAPAALYALHASTRAGRAAAGRWVRDHGPWLLGFAALALPGLLMLFAGPLRAARQGDGLERPLWEFTQFGVPAWGYVAPTPLHVLQRLLGRDLYDATGHPMIECASYLGVVTLGLVVVAALGRARLRDARYWWLALGVLVVLSMGATARLGSARVSLPGLWLWNHVGPFRLIRSPGRFNLLAAVCAGVVAAGGARRLLAALPGARSRVLLWAVLAALALADLAMVPFLEAPVPAMPAAHAFLKQRDPAMTVLELPLDISCHASAPSALRGYWQTLHHGRTTAGYSGIANTDFDHRLVLNMPFSRASMEEPGWLRDPERTRFGLARDVSFRDHAWLYLKVNGLRYVLAPRGSEVASRLEGQFADARIYVDASTAVFEADRLPAPARPAALCANGWRGGWHGRDCLEARGAAGIALYVPAGDQPVVLRIDARSCRQPRTARLLEGSTELARWVVAPGDLHAYESPTMRLPPGIHHLTLEAEPDTRPDLREAGATSAEKLAARLVVHGVSVRSVGDGAKWLSTSRASRDSMGATH